MNKRSLKAFIASCSILFPAVTLSISATSYVPKQERYFSFPNKKFAANIQYENKTIHFNNDFRVPGGAPSYIPKKDFKMRIWEPKNWEDISKPNEELENNKWKALKLEDNVDDPRDNGCENPYGELGVCTPTFYTKATGFEKIVEHDSLDSLLKFIYWKKLEKDDERINKDPFINTFKYRLTSALKKSFENYSELEKYIQKITIRLKAENMIANHSYVGESDRDRYQFPEGKIEYTNLNNWGDLITNYEIKVDLRIPKEIAHPFSKYQNDFNKLKNELNHRVNWTIESDTGGKLRSDEIKKDGYETNISKLDKKIQAFNSSNKNNSNLRVEFLVTSDDTIDLYIKNEDGSFKELVGKNIRIPFRNSQKYKNYVETVDIEDRLKIKLGKWVDFKSGTTKLVDDVLVQDTNDKKSINKNGKTRYGGRWIAHAPLKVSFTTKDDEKEILEINGKKIDVLNYYFEDNLVDNRKDANDTEREFNANFKGDKEKTLKNNDNSHAKNEYKIKITKFSDAANKVIDYTYEKIIVIDSRSSQMNFKWYAWNPAENKHQKELIEEFLMDDKGKTKVDDKNNPIKNPKYDPLIDKKTGTKKQLVWFDFNKMEYEWSNLFSLAKEKTYYKTTKLPAYSKTLFAPHSNEQDLDAGVIMEAAVLEKGALRSLIGKNKNSHLYRLNENNEWIKAKNEEFVKDLSKETTEASYFSEEGIWLFASNADNSISNFKLILIKDKTSPYTQFLDNLPKLNHIKPLWQTKQGKKFFEWLEIVKELKFNQIVKLNYEDAMEYYKQYINDLWVGAQYNSPIAISPKFKEIKKQKDIKDIATIEKFEKFVDKFEHDDKVELSKVEVAGNNFLKVSFRLITTDSRYRLSQETYGVMVPIDKTPSSGNSNGNSDNSSNAQKDKTTDENKEIINLKLNSQLFLNLALKNSYSSFLNALKTINTKDVFLDLEERHLKLLDVKFSTNEILKRLKIKVNFKKKDYETKYKIIPNNTFYLNLEFAKSIADNNANDRNPIKPIPNEDDWDHTKPSDSSSANNPSNKNVDDESDISKDKRSIFNGIVFKRINLKGTNSLEETKEEIKKQIQLQTPSLKIDVDYTILNLEQVAYARQYPQTHIQNENDLSISIANLQALNNKFGYAQVEVINTVNQVLDGDIDLAKIKLNNISLNESKLSMLKTKVIDEINKQFKVHNLEVEKDLLIENWDLGIRALALGNGISTKFKIVGNNIKIKNSTFVKITNSATNVINDEKDPSNTHGNNDGSNNEINNNNISNKLLYDLSYIWLEKLSFSEHILSELRQKILKTIIEQLSLRFFIEYKKHYDIDLNELNNIVKKLGKKSNEPIIASLSLKEIPNVSKNKAFINISNNNKLFDPINDLNKPLNINNNSKKLTKKQVLLIFIPLGILGATGLITLISFIYVRRIKNKIK